ncbi:hypothetical protein C366_06892 [Cryptococcus neoformans Tu401-1]|nr:hypothetical protein C366_06892 [Cryptococcus neoformans var. grubii Tu401-1]OXM75454.1 hypothetical protein C364_06865 [Cryptococcus neoformans var. grubii Bt63]
MSATKDTFDLRAEEDAARRLNVGRVLPSAALSGTNSRAKHTELIGKPFLRQKVEAASKSHGIKFDEEATLYLTGAIESSLRSLINLTRAAQLHRTSSSHLHAPPMAKSSSKSSDEREGKPMWSLTLRDDPNAVIEALNRRNRDAEQEFRKMRMDRLARDAELQKARERQAAQSQAAEAASPSPTTAAVSPTESSSSPSTPSKPLFGAAKETPKGTPSTSSSSKKKSTTKKPSSRDVSAEVQHKMTNLTAMRSAGMGKKYGWMMGNAPAVSSPLAGKKRKAEGAESKEKDGEKGKARESPLGQDRPNKKARPIPAPTRRMVAVSSPPPPPPVLNTAASNPNNTTTDKAEPQKVSDDKALTMVDLVFALEHGGLGQAGGLGMGSVSGDILQGIWAKGGPWSESEGKKP